jgi:hypothetical protein
MRKKRCPDCDEDGYVYKDDAWVKCPLCDGSTRIEREVEPMDESQMYRLLMVGCACLAALCGVGAAGVLVLCATDFSIGALVAAIGLTAGCVASGYFTTEFGSKAEEPKVFNNQDEKEVLTRKQRQVLKEARGEVVMQRAMIEVEHERQNIVHNLELEAADDLDRPPHQTRWSPNVRSLDDPRRQT